MNERRHIAVYIMTNQYNTVLYVGVTSNLEQRVWKHRMGFNKKSFTYKYNLNKLVWFENYEQMDPAILREKQIKRWSRVKKDELINSMNPEWNDLMPHLPIT